MILGESTGFAASILSGLRTAPFVRIAVPRGRDLDGAIGELIVAAFGQDVHPIRVNLASIARVQEFYQTLSEHIGSGQIAYGIDDLVNFGDWWQTRLFILAGDSPDTRMMTQVLAEARLVADATRDRSAPIRFLWAHGAGSMHLEIDMPLQVWPADWRYIPLIDTSGNLDSTLYRTFRAYLDLRVYWESAGQKDLVRRLSDRVLRLGLSYDSVGVDASLDRVFDAEPMGGDDVRVASDCLAEPAHRETWVAGLRQGFFPTVEPISLKRWNAAGLIWRPPGIARWQVTPECIRILLQYPNHPLRASLDSEALDARLAQARACSHIAQFALILSTQVETELLDALRPLAFWQLSLERRDLADGLKRNRNRALINAFAYQASTCLLDYATFGQLVALAEDARNGFVFPLSLERLWDITAVRNHAAHGNAVRWNGIKILVEALSALAT